MGTVRKRLDQGVWFIDYIAADGRRMREVIGPGAENKRLARKILAQREAEATLGQHRILPGRTPRFSDYADDWLARKEAGLRPKTRESYRSMVDLHLRPAFGEMRLGAISRHHVETFLAAHQEVRSKRGKTGERPVLSATTVNYALRILKSVLSDAVELGELTENVVSARKAASFPGRGREGRDALRHAGGDCPAPRRRG